MPSKSTLLLIALGISACNRELKKEHEQLAVALAKPAAILCHLDFKEGGGCNGDCIIRTHAESGVALARASALLKDLPPARDPNTESNLAVIRERATLLTRSLGAHCSGSVDRDAPITPATQACAHSYDQQWNARGQLFDALGMLRDDAKNSSGVELPDHRECAEE